MESIGRSSNGVHDALRAASTAANSTDPREMAGLVELLNQLKALGGELQMESKRDEAELCGLGIEIAQRLIGQRYPSPEEILPWVGRILAFLGSSLGVDLTDEWTSMNV